MSGDLLKGRRPFEVDEGLLERVEAKVREIVTAEEGVALAMLFGSFVKRRFARDVDLAIYLAGEVDLYDALEYSELLGERLEREVGLPFDVVVLNHADEGLLMRVLLKGRRVLVRNPLLYQGLRMLALEVRNRFLLGRHRGFEEKA